LDIRLYSVTTSKTHNSNSWSFRFRVSPSKITRSTKESWIMLSTWGIVRFNVLNFPTNASNMRPWSFQANKYIWLGKKLLTYH
jgi:hypothetical protein